MEISDERLVELAIEAREHAYVPYSHFAVGAALLTADGSVYQGCNIENAAYTPSNCAERTAFFKAIYDGERSFSTIAVVGGPEGKPISDWCAPCGVCRQVMREFCDPDSFRIVLARSTDERRSLLLRELLPEGFGPEDLGHPAPAAKDGGAA
jgi:cytidine deaminase